ncbi:hypothetical protein [Curtobacterium sp. Curtsp57]|uniref:hypothetical protein n=1 Tax=Curtobacterium sp. Curtsp57 TaxID=3243047 RepID=UPI0039B38615
MMSMFHTSLVGIAVGAIVAGSLFLAPAANAAEATTVVPTVVDIAQTHPEITPEMVNDAVAEALHDGTD